MFTDESVCFAFVLLKDALNLTLSSDGSNPIVSRMEMDSVLRVILSAVLEKSDTISADRGRGPNTLQGLLLFRGVTHGYPFLLHSSAGRLT